MSLTQVGSLHHKHELYILFYNTDTKKFYYSSSTNNTQHRSITLTPAHVHTKNYNGFTLTFFDQLFTNNRCWEGLKCTLWTMDVPQWTWEMLMGKQNR